MLEDSFLRALSRVVREQPLAEKVLILDSLSAGQTLLERLALAGQPWVNLRCATPLTLAADLAADELAAAGLEHADGVMTFLLATELASNTPEVVTFLAEVGLGPGVLRAVHRSLCELRMNGNTADRLPAEAFLDPLKGQALVSLLRAYEQELIGRKWADDAEILERATEIIHNDCGRCSIYLIPRICLERATGLVRRFLTALPAENLRIIEPETPTGLGALTSAALPAEGGKPPAEIDLFAADGIDQEIREVIRRVVEADAPLEEAVILIPREEGYLRAMRDLAARLDLPYTSSSGFPVTWTRPGRAALALLAWLSTDCSVRVLAQSLAAGDIRLPPEAEEDGPSGSACSRLLRTAGIGWGRARYLPALATLQASYEQQIEESGESGTDETWRREKIRTITALRAWIEALIDLMPQPDEGGRIPLNGLCRAVGTAVERYAGAVSADDHAARKAVIERMRIAGTWASGSFPIREAVEHVRAMVSELRVGSSGPKPGCLHIVPQNAGWYAGRRHVFLVGLDESNYPPAPLADPLLLDEERSAVDPPLPTGTEIAGGALAGLTWTLDCLEGRITCSYSTRQPGEDRRSFPSSLLLQAYRWNTANPHAGYDDLNAALRHASAVPAGRDRTVFSRDEWWLGRIAAGPVWAFGQDLIERAYPHLGRGRMLLSARASEAFTPYDGFIGARSPDLDPRGVPDLVLSPSRLERLGRCPLGYFFLYVLGIEPPREIERDPGRWLDAAARGTLLHAIFRRFYERLGGRVTGGEAEWELLLAVCQESLEEFRREIPPPSEAVYERERAEIHASAGFFLDMERHDEATSVPVYFEVPFGRGVESLREGSPGLADPIVIQLPGGGAIRLRGQIDRIDRVGEHIYRIWDYKSGRGYPEGGRIDQGRRLQHALYAIAAEEILRGPGGDAQARVEASGYRFPTLRGEGRPIWLPEGDARTAALRAVDHLCALAASGVFIAGADATTCRYCDYFEVCGENAAECAKEKIKAGPPEELTPFMEVRSLA